MMHFLKGLLFVRKSLYDGGFKFASFSSFFIQNAVAMGIDDILKYFSKSKFTIM